MRCRRKGQDKEAVALAYEKRYKLRPERTWITTENPCFLRKHVSNLHISRFANFWLTNPDISPLSIPSF